MMKKILSIFFACCLILLPLLGAAESTEAQKTIVVCLGDSITFGAGVTGRENTYPGMLQALLGEQYSVKNCGENGRTLQRKGMLDVPDAKLNAPMTYWDSRVMKNAVKAEPNIVIIMLGTNDAKWFNWNSEEYARQYIELVQYFQALESVADVYVMIPPPGFNPHEGTETVESIDRGILANEVGPCVRAVSKEFGCGIIDLYSALLDRGDLFPDGIHPNAEGNAIIAQKIYETVTWH